MPWNTEGWLEKLNVEENEQGNLRTRWRGIFLSGFAHSCRPTYSQLIFALDLYRRRARLISVEFLHGSRYKLSE